MYVERYRRLRDLREDHDLTQAQVGDAINITQRAYSYYESGQHIIPPEVLLRLADPNRPAAGPGGCSWPPCAGNTA